MSNAHDRRAPGTARIPFDAMVEVGGALGPSFEAQAVNLSGEGMSLRTAYLPDVGQPVMCRFDAGQGLCVVAAGEVQWKDDLGDGGEFGIRFTNLDSHSVAALQRVLSVGDDAPAVDPHGRKVRLHIDGLASPMRARIKNQQATGVTAYSELGFLQMGKPLQLEDATSGNRRPAMIDRVEVEVDQGSRIPQLIVSLRYDDAAGQAAIAAGAHEVHIEEDETPRNHPSHETEASPESGPELEAESPVDPAAFAAANVTPAQGVEAASPQDIEESSRLKSAFARSAAKVTPTLLGWAKRAKIAAALLAARARRETTGDDVEIPVRRTTAPAPGGGLHAEGRKVVRHGSMTDLGFEQELHPSEPKKAPFKMTRKKAGVGAAVGIAAFLVFVAARKPAPAPQLASAPPAESAEIAPAAPVTTAALPVAPPVDPLAAAAAAMSKPTGGGRATPFTNGPVGSHPTVLKIKMDGPIEGILGAPQPTGFTIVIPNRKTAEPSNALADKDPRLAAVNVSNEQGGAEFSVSFKDGVPNYLVRAHGDTLEMVLAKTGGIQKAEAHQKKKSTKKKH